MGEKAAFYWMWNHMMFAFVCEGDFAFYHWMSDGRKQDHLADIPYTYA